MKIGNKEVRVEDGVIIGTASDKYESRNAIAQKMVDGFDNGIRHLLDNVAPNTITEVGCGEGHVSSILLQKTQAPIKAMDLSQAVLDEAQQYTDSDRIMFEKCSIYDTTPQRHQAELVVCCEVLEHLEDPQRGLEKLAQLANPWALLSVPREPIWRLLNMARGAYLRDFGNTPGHLQHWSKKSFIRFVSARFEVIEVITPLPWTLLLARLK